MTRFGAAGTSALITLFSMVAAVFITLVIFFLVEGPGAPVTGQLIGTPLLSALIIAPPASYFALRLLQNLIQAETQNNHLISELSRALDEVKHLSGLLPICAHCKNIRDEDSRWHPLDVYVAKFSDAEFSHGICPECMSRHYPRADTQRQ